MALSLGQLPVTGIPVFQTGLTAGVIWGIG